MYIRLKLYNYTCKRKFVNRKKNESIMILKAKIKLLRE